LRKQKEKQPEEDVIGCWGNPVLNSLLQQFQSEMRTIGPFKEGKTDLEHLQHHLCGVQELCEMFSGAPNEERSIVAEGGVFATQRRDQVV